jgi:hypothetical protein
LTGKSLRRGVDWADGELDVEWGAGLDLYTKRGYPLRRLKLFVSVSFVACCVLALSATAASAAPLYPQCPPVFHDTGCQFLVTVSNSGDSIAEDPTQGPYEASDDALIGIQNSSSSPVSSIHLSAEDELFGFDGDGICAPGGGPTPEGCKVQPYLNFSTKEKTLDSGDECGYEGELREEKGKKEKLSETIEEACAFAVPAGEPAGVTFPEGIDIVGYGANGDPVTGYEGPTSWFSGIGALGSSPTGSGTINFSPAIPPGGTSYFSLESPPAGGFGSGSTLSTTLSGGGQSGASITVIQGTAVSDTATLSGANAPSATGTVSYNVYSDPNCTTLVAAAGTGALSAGAGAASSGESLNPGVYYWQASYGGDLNNKGAVSACGSETLTVLAPSSTSTIQSGGGLSGASIPVLMGTGVSDQAHIAGSEAASATGTVTYTLYSDSKCTKAVSSSVEPVNAGVATASAAVTPSKVGTYYWTATYSGGGLNAASASACGSETLVVSKHANLGLPSGKMCRSKRDITVHPHFPNGAKIVRYEEFINGNLVKSGHLNHNATSVNLIGLPKGTYKVELVTFTASGASYEDERTFHTCVVKHKHHKK